MYERATGFGKKSNGTPNWNLSLQPGLSLRGRTEFSCVKAPLSLSMQGGGRELSRWKKPRAGGDALMGNCGIEREREGEKDRQGGQGEHEHEITSTTKCRAEKKSS